MTSLQCVVDGCSGPLILCDAHAPYVDHATKLRLLRALEPDGDGQPLDTPHWRAAVELVNAKVAAATDVPPVR